MFDIIRDPYKIINLKSTNLLIITLIGKVNLSLKSNLL